MTAGTPGARRFATSGPLRGTLRLPGDKSISHRALILNAIAAGPARIAGLLDADDVHATRRAVEQLGVGVRPDAGGWVVDPPPSGRLAEPADVVDCGNSGTSIRLLAGVLAARPMFAVLTGDASLRRRPMARIVGPLRAMGARVDGRGDGSFAPLAIRGGAPRFVAHDLAISSAQVKSAIVLAGLESGVAVREPRSSRDHTERMLRAMGVRLATDPEGWLQVAPAATLAPVDVEVPADLSAAAFFLVAASLIPGSDLVLPGVGVNPTRTGVVDALRAMGADLSVEGTTEVGGEPRADLRVRHAPLRGVHLDGALALRCLDELPVLAVAAAFATGVTTIADAAELRHKESDRIARMSQGLRALGIEVEERPDGMVIEGGRPRGSARIDATGDHRIGMSFAVAALAGADDLEIAGAESVSSSYPRFYDDLASLGR